MKQHIGVGFVTGRGLFQDVLKTYINNWLEHGIIQDKKIKLHLFIAYDLKYKNTKIDDYKNIPPELMDMVESVNFYGQDEIDDQVNGIVENETLSPGEASLIFGDGYAKRRNLILYSAIKLKMDKLIFIDDDEYPIATLRNNYGKSLIWMGQSILSTHLKYNDKADITHGYHCGYISPVPFVKFNTDLPEADFKNFIDAISNDIISWEKIKHLLIENKGVTFAEQEVINGRKTVEVEQENGMKFISGANLCFNLREFGKLPPFYNPPGARGEDTFMSTSLSDLKVLRVPCYTFHDGFSLYNNILNGVLPVNLSPIEANSPEIVKRFISAAIGWIRYKPLMVYITKPDDYHLIMKDIEQKLRSSIPKLCKYFGTVAFKDIYKEFVKYTENVEEHFQDFQQTKQAWSKLLNGVI